MGGRSEFTDVMTTDGHGIACFSQATSAADGTVACTTGCPAVKAVADCTAGLGAVFLHLAAQLRSNAFSWNFSTSWHRVSLCGAAVRPPPQQVTWIFNLE